MSILSLFTIKIFTSEDTSEIFLIATIPLSLGKNLRGDDSLGLLLHSIPVVKLNIIMITLILLIFAYTMIGKPLGNLPSKIKNVNWCELTSAVWKLIKSFGIKAGRTTCEPLLYFYYVMLDENTSICDKALIYGAILYILSPFDLLPRRILGIVGIIDDAAVIALVLNKIYDKITPEIKAKVDITLNQWFGSYPVIN